MASFSISKDFIIHQLVDYYLGDDSLKNPMKLFLENEAIDEEIINHVLSTMKSKRAITFLCIDLWLNNPLRYLIPSNLMTETKSFLIKILSDDTRGLRVTKYLDNFHEANLNEKDFDWILSEHKVDVEFGDIGLIQLSTQLISHKDYPIDKKMFFYEKTGNEKFLPAAAKDMFLF